MGLGAVVHNVSTCIVACDTKLVHLTYASMCLTVDIKISLPIMLVNFVYYMQDCVS